MQQETQHLKSFGSRNVLAAVIERDEHFLVCKRPDHKRHGSLWEFPGGKLEPGESWQQAAQRELKEELDLQVTHVGNVILSVACPDSDFIINFVNVKAEGNPKLIEHTALKWLPLGELLELPLAPSDRSFVEYLNKNLTSNTDILAGQQEAKVSTQDNGTQS